MKHGGMLNADPTENGTYIAEVFYGWKVLEWYDGRWWHKELVGRWTASKPLQWIGPLPPLVGFKKEKAPDPVYDL